MKLLPINIHALIVYIDTVERLIMHPQRYWATHKGQFSMSQIIIVFPTVLTHFKPLRRGQPLSHVAAEVTVPNVSFVWSFTVDQRRVWGKMAKYKGLYLISHLY